MMKVDDFMVTLNRMKDMQRKRDLRAFRDDLIRLVVGMQWQMAMLHHTATDGGWINEWPRVRPWSDLRPAVDIVDEWLGVR